MTSLSDPPCLIEHELYVENADIYVFIRRLSLFKKGHAVFLIIIVLSLARFLSLSLVMTCYDSSHGQPFYFKPKFC